MLVRTLRFGQMEVPDDKVITMERPILGFETLISFCLISVDELTPFMWLQSVENPTVAFLVVNPAIFFPDYRIEINSNEIAELRVRNVGAVETYTIVTLAENPSEISVNLQGPLIVNTDNNKAKQLVLVNSPYKVRHSLLEAVGQGTDVLVRSEMATV
jgi:flagellar assembly factor FliW